MVRKLIASKLSIFLLASFICQIGRADNVDDIDSSSLGVVLTPTRLKQSISDVPASVTVITADMITNLGIKNIPDALRLVPGMAVTQITGNDYRINYHGTNILVPRRMNVLLDGVSIYGLSIARVDWISLPVPLEDIERIEVTRGSDSAAYGANSMLAVINIKTKNPKDSNTNMISVLGGSSDTANAVARFGGTLFGNSNYHILLSHEGNDGYDWASIFGLGHDNTRVNRANFHVHSEFGVNESLELQAVLMQSNIGSEYVDGSQKTLPDVTENTYQLNAIWKKDISFDHLIQIQAYTTHQNNIQGWKSCVPEATLLHSLYELGLISPSYANAIASGKVPNGGSPEANALALQVLTDIKKLGSSAKNLICLNTNQNYTEQRNDIEFQDTRILSNQLRMVNGFGVRYDLAKSGTFFKGEVSNVTYRAFSNVEYKPVDSVNINAGGFYEKDQITGSAFSPRIALNYHFDEINTVRFIVSQAIRMPDMLEQRANWAYQTSDYSTPLNGATSGFFYRSAHAPGNLIGERSISKEIGYLGNFENKGLIIDAKLFRDNMYDLVSQKLQNSDFNPTNTSWDYLSGLELQLTYQPNGSNFIHAGYTHLNLHVSSIFEATQYAKDSGAIAISHSFDNNANVSFAIYQYGATTNGQSSYGREDITWSKPYGSVKYQIIPTFTVSHLDNTKASIQNNIGVTRSSTYNSAWKLYAGFKLNY